MANMHLVTGYAGTPHVTAADFGAFWAAIIGGGDYVLDHGQNFAATIVSNNLIRIADGELLMQGRHGRIENGTTVDLTIENGTAGTQRRDLIVARYTKSEETGVEEVNLVVILGTPAESSPVDPEYITGDILTGDMQRDFPLFRVNLNGITITGIDTLFSSFHGMLANNENLAEELRREMDAVEDMTAKFAYGTYTGTGTAGASNKNSISCGFTPKYVMIAPTDDITEFVYFHGVGVWKKINSLTVTIDYTPKYPQMGEEGEKNVTLTNTITVAASTNGISWYTEIPATDTIGSGYQSSTGNVPITARAKAQYNTSGTKYYYIVIG